METVLIHFVGLQVLSLSNTVLGIAALVAASIKT